MQTETLRTVSFLGGGGGAILKSNELLIGAGSSQCDELGTNTCKRAVGDVRRIRTHIALMLRSLTGVSASFQAGRISVSAVVCVSTQANEIMLRGRSPG